MKRPPFIHVWKSAAAGAIAALALRGAFDSNGTVEGTTAIAAIGAFWGLCFAVWATL